MRRTRTRVTVLGSAIMVILAANIAFAAWTASGTGSGTATSGAGQAVSALGPASVTDLLYPTGSANVQLTISNPNPYKVSVTQIAQNGSTASDDENCVGTTVTMATQTTGWIVPAASGATPGTLAVTLTDAATMSNAATDACQTANFTIPVSLTAASSN